jgi:hypothetical protein
VCPTALKDTVGEIAWKSIDAAVYENMAAFYATIMESFQFIPVVPGAPVRFC